MADFRLWGQVEQFPVAWVFEKVIQMFEYVFLGFGVLIGCHHQTMANELKQPLTTVIDSLS